MQAASDVVMTVAENLAPELTKDWMMGGMGPLKRGTCQSGPFYELTGLKISS